MSSGEADDRGREKESCYGRGDMRHVLHHRAGQADGAGPQWSFGYPGFAGLLDDVLGEFAGGRISHLDPPPGARLPANSSRNYLMSENTGHFYSPAVTLSMAAFVKLDPEPAHYPS